MPGSRPYLIRKTFGEIDDHIKQESKENAEYWEYKVGPIRTVENDEMKTGISVAATDHNGFGVSFQMYRESDGDSDACHALHGWLSIEDAGILLANLTAAYWEAKEMEEKRAK